MYLRKSFLIRLQSIRYILMSQVRSSVAYSVFAKINFKIIIVGDSYVGKTSLILRYVKGTFNKNYSVSLGVEFYSKVLTINGEEVVLQMWDTAGQQNFKSIVKSFYNKASCVIIAYSKPELLRKTIDNYFLEINEHALNGVRVIVVRTKNDQIPMTQEERNILDEQMKQKKIDFWMDVSSLSGQNIEALFSKMTNFLYDLYKTNDQFKELVDPKKDSFTLEENLKKTKMGGKKEREKRKCCQ